MLMNDLYSCRDVQATENDSTCTIDFNANHDIFKGHFPGQPVVPGVCMMEMVKELFQQQTGKNVWLRSAGNVKFLQLITPDLSPLVKINWKENGDSYDINASFHLDTAVLFKMNGTYDRL